MVIFRTEQKNTLSVIVSGKNGFEQRRDGNFLSVVNITCSPMFSITCINGFICCDSFSVVLVI